MSTADPPSSTILLVDDHAANLIALQGVLNPLGYPLVEAGSGIDALEYLSRNDCGLILMDVQMPGLDGIETVRRLRREERHRHTPVIFLTAGDQLLASAADAYAEGAVDYMVKPFRPEILRAKVRAIFGLQRRASDLQAREESVRRREYEAERADLLNREKLARMEAEASRQNLEGSRQALRLQVGITRAITDNASVGLVLMDEHQHCTFLNPAAERLFGLTLRQLQGKPLHDFVHHMRPDGSAYPMSECPIDRALPTRAQERGEEVFVRPDGSFYPVAFTTSPIMDRDKPVATVVEIRDITEEKRHQELERRRARHALLVGDVGAALTQENTLHGTLQRCSESVVRHLNAAFARIWTLEQEGAGLQLQLQASAGRYSHLDGARDSVPIGELKIGLIAEQGQPYLTNDVLDDPQLCDEEWARREGMVGFAGYPLLLGGKVLGVLAMLANRPLEPDVLDALASVADAVALGVQRLRAEDARRESETRYRLATRATKDAIRNWNLATNAVEWNEGCGELFGYSEEEIVPTATWWYEHIHLEDRQRVLQGIQEVIASGHAPRWQDEYRFLKKDGTYALVTDRGWVSRHPSGQAVRMVGAIQDVTQQRRTEEALRESEARFRNMADYAPVMLRVTDAAGLCTYLSRRWYDFTGQTQEAGLGMGWLGAVHPEDARRARDVFLAANARFAAFRLEYRLSRKDGEHRWAMDSAQPRFGAGGEFLGYIGSVIDITERKTAEEAMAQVNQTLETRVRERTSALQEANQALESFSYSVSHDLRAPLRHIGGFAELLENRSSEVLDAKAKHYLKTIREAAHRGGQLVDDLLAFSRMGRTEMSEQTVSLDAVIEEVRKELSLDADGRQIEWRVAPLPDVQGDLPMLRIVFKNLLANALKYTRPKAVARVEVGAREVGDQVEIFVRDNGVGFDMQFADKLFGVFQRLHPADQFEGTGIGLATVRRIVQRHGGRTWAESTAGEGAMFCLTLQPASALSQK